MNLQNVFDTVAKHLLTQNKRSENTIVQEDGIADTICAYRGENGLKCAIGALIKDEFYQPSLENQTPASNQVQNALKASGIEVGEDFTAESNYWFLQELQMVHDDFDPKNWLVELNQLASNYGLKPYQP
jgi:hypothetical protein